MSVFILRWHDHGVDLDKPFSLKAKDWDDAVEQALTLFPQYRDHETVQLRAVSELQIEDKPVDKQTVVVHLEPRSRKLVRQISGLEDMQDADLAEEIGVLVLDAVLYGRPAALKRALKLARQSAEFVINEATDESNREPGYK